jgi:Ca2+-binding RTX toxin-like protein
MGKLGVRQRGAALLSASALLVGTALGAVAQPTAAAVPVGAGFTVTPGDLAFILAQIRIAERHATTLTGTNPCGTLLAQPGEGIPDAEQVPDVLTPYGLRTVDGSCNNLTAPSGFPTGPARFGASDQVFPRLTTPVFRGGYAQKNGDVVDPQPRLISNLIDDQTATNPAAVAAAAHPLRSQHPNIATAVPCTTDPDPATDPPTIADPPGCTPSHHTLFIPNIATNAGLAPPYNSLFTFFGQFFDHGLDQTVKSGGSVFIPLQPDDPLITLGPDGKPGTGDEVPPAQAFMVLTRARNQPGPDGVLGTADDVQDAANTDTPWIDQSQTYASHASHQVFLREYQRGSGDVGPTSPAAVSDGKLLGGIAADDPLPCTKPAPFECYNDGAAGPGSLATWASVRQQAHDLLGLRLEDKDVLNVPMLATDPYGKYLPGPHGLPQYVTATGLVEGRLDDPATPDVDETVPVPANVIYFDTPFIGDIAHNADPSPDPQTGKAPKPDPDSTVQTDFTQQPPGTYDDELLADHFACGDGRCNENIALSAIHQVFHSEHDRLVDDIKAVLSTDTSPGAAARLADWESTDSIASANGTGRYGFGEKLFQAARFVDEMEYQHLVFEQFVRKVQPAVRPFHVYSPDVNPAIDAEFAEAVYRFGHSMLDDTVARTTIDPVSGQPVDDSLPLLHAFLSPPAYFQSTIGPLTPRQAAGSIILGSSGQTGNEIDEFVTETLRNNLLGLPLDLPAINIARAREMGIPPLTEVRRQLFAQTHDPQLAPYTSWADFGQHLKHPESLINFVAAYGTHPSIVAATTIAGKRDAARAIVAPTNADTPPADASQFMFGTGAWANRPTGLDDVDLWVGGLAEVTPQNGGMLGSTFNYVFQTQMEKLQDNDRFYYLARTAGLNLLSQLESDTFAELFERNTDGTSALKADAFAISDCTFHLSHLSGPASSGAFTGAGSVTDDPTTACDENKLLLQQPDGTIQYRLLNPVDPPGINAQAVFDGTPGPDKIVGGVDDDTFWAGGGNDVIDGNNGNDTVFGGDGNDDISDSSGADLLFGGPGNDAIDGGIGNDIEIGGDGSDLVNGGANDNQEFGGPGNDYIIAGQGADTAFGDGGDDWIEGGTGVDALQGDHGAPFFTDPGELSPGNDILIGQSGDNTYSAEGGDDIMAQSLAVDRNIGAAGFDWATHQYDTAPANDDMMINNNQGGLPIEVLVNRDRWQEVEADSGSAGDDVIKGTDGVLARPRRIGGAGFLGCDALDQAGVARIPGLAALLPPVGAWPGTAADVAAISAAGRCPLSGPVWGEGDILLGGPGNDTITGRAGDDIIDGDRQLQVGIAVTDGHGNELGRTDLIEHPATSGTFGPGTDGMGLQQAIFAGLVDPGRLENVRAIVDPVSGLGNCAAVTPVNCDTAVYAGPRSQYAITANQNGSVTVQDLAAAPDAGDGTDTLFAVERLQFDDATVDLTVPTNVVAIAGDHRATVSWIPAISLGGPITGYTVTAVGDPTVLASVAGTATSATITGLTNGTGYSFVVRAVTEQGNGAASDPSNAITPAVPPPAVDPPGAPTVSAASPGDGSATLIWTVPVSDGGAPIAGYVVEVQLAGTGTAVATQSVAAGATSASVAGLPAETPYRLRVRAVNAAGPGSWSALSAAVTPYTKPGPPTIASVSPHNGAASVCWSAPPDNGGRPVTSYTVQLLDADGSQVGPAHPVAGSTLTVARLDNGSSYTFLVRAVNLAGAGAPATSVPVVPRTTPGAPVSVDTTIGNGSVTLAWTPPAQDGGAAVTGYQIRIVDLSGQRPDVHRDVQSATSSLLVTGLTNGVQYRAEVSAVNDAGAGAAATAGFVPITVPGRPGLGRPVPGDRRVTLTWTPPTDTGGDPVTDYVVRYFAADGPRQLSAGAATTLSVTGLDNGVAYQFQVAAVNSAGPGPFTSLSASAVPRTIPAAPTGVSAHRGEGSAVVGWTAPANDGGAAVSRYEVQVLDDHGAPVGPTHRTDGVATSLAVTGLTNGSGYRFRVRAVNAAGAGAYSVASNRVVPLGLPRAPRIGAARPGAPGGAVTAGVAWRPPPGDGGTPVTTYVVTALRLGAGSAVLSRTVVVVGASRRSVSMQLAAGRYVFTVTAQNAVGPGPASARSNRVRAR